MLPCGGREEAPGVGNCPPDAEGGDVGEAPGAAESCAASDLSALVAGADSGVPTRSVAQAISCRPQDVRAPGKRERGGRSAHGDVKHHQGSHRAYMSYKIEKLGAQNDEVQAAGGVFAGVSIYVNGLTEPSWLDLKDLMLSNGGGFANYYSRDAVTHVVCANLTDAKLAQLKRADRHHPPVVRPEWVTQSLAAGKLLPCAAFALARTLDPGQRRMTSVLTRAAEPTPEDTAPSNPPRDGPAGDPDANENETAHDEARDEDEAEAVDAPSDVMATQEAEDDDRDDRPIGREGGGGVVSDRPIGREEDEAARGGVLVVRVVFETVVEQLARIVPTAGEYDVPVQSGGLGAVRVASAAAYGALTAAVDPSRVVPVSAAEALVEIFDLGGNRTDATAHDEAGRIAAALTAAGVRASAACTLLCAPRTAGVLPAQPPPLRPIGRSDTTPPPPSRPIRRSAMTATPGEALKHAERRPPSTSAKRVRWSRRLEEDASVPSDGDDGPIGREGGGGVIADRPIGREGGGGGGHEGGSVGAGPRRSSFAAAARDVELGQIDAATLAELPPALRAELRAELRQRRRERFFGPPRRHPQPKSHRYTMSPRPAPSPAAARDDALVPALGERGGGGGGGGGFDAFGALLGMRRAGGSRTADRANSGWAAPSAREEGDGVHDDGLPSSYSQIDAGFLEAIGEEERRRLREQYAAARQLGGRAGPRTGGGQNRSTGTLRDLGDVCVVDTEGRATTSAVLEDGWADGGGGTDGTDGARGLEASTADVDVEEKAVPRGDMLGEDAVVPLTRDADVDAFNAALEACVRLGASPERPPSPRGARASALVAAAELLAAQGIAQAEAHHLESVRRIMLCGRRLAEEHPRRWKGLFEGALRRVRAAVRREYQGAELVLRR